MRKFILFTFILTFLLSGFINQAKCADTYSVQIRTYILYGSYPVIQDAYYWGGSQPGDLGICWYVVCGFTTDPDGQYYSEDYDFLTWTVKDNGMIVGSGTWWQGDDPICGPPEPEPIEENSGSSYGYFNMLAIIRRDTDDLLTDFKEE